VAACDTRNTASLRVVDRLGMRREFEFVDNELVKGEWASEIVCPMLDSDRPAALIASRSVGA
jgi:RimJ/RimL family protein N-acetyltransferase